MTATAVHTWLEFMLGRPEPTVAQTKLVHDPREFAWHCFLCSLYFSALCLGLPRLIKRLFPAFYAALDETKLAELPAFASGFMHHIVIVPIGLLDIYRDYLRTGTAALEIDYVRTLTASVSAVPFTFGYIVGDTLFLAIGELLKGKVAYAIHHGATFVLYYVLLQAQGSIVRYMPHLYICEASNLVFEVAWFLRAAGYRDSLAIQVVEILFVVVFFVTRIVNLPICVYAVVALPGTKLLSAVLPWTLGVVVLLQFYWFARILQVLAGKIARRSAGKEKKDK